MEDDPISSSDEDSPPPTQKSSLTTTTSASTAKLCIPPRKKHITRSLSVLYDSLSTGKTKDELLASSRFNSSVKTKEQARKFLIEYDLLPLNQDPDHSALCKILLNLEQKIPGLTAPGADAIRAVAIILNSQASDASPPGQTHPIAAPEFPIPPPASLATELSKQVSEIKASIQELRRATATNETSANMLMNMVDTTRNELHAAAEVVSEAVGTLTNSFDSSSVPTPSAPQSLSSPSLDQHDISKTLQEIKSLIRDKPPLSPPSPYRDALLKTNQPHQVPNLASLQEQARANAAAKETQMLLDLDEDHPIKKQIHSRDEMLTIFQTALSEIKEESGPDLKLRTLKLLKNGGILLEFLDKNAIEWLKPNERRNSLAAATGGSLRIKDRLFNVVVQFVPISTTIEDDETLRIIEEDSKILKDSIASAKWIKPVNKRSPFQRFAHAIFSISSPVIANQIIKQGIYVNRECLRAYKDKKEPLRCLKCQEWGHIARTCKAQIDTCGTCADNHRSSTCPSEKPPYCVSCKSTDHPSSSRKCPEFIRKCQELNARTPENTMPYFPTEEEWTQVPLPPKATGPIVPTRPPTAPTAPPPPRNKPQQTKINNYYGTSQKKTTQPPTNSSARPSSPSPTSTPTHAPDLSQWASQSSSADPQKESSPTPQEPSSPQEAPPSRFPTLSPLLPSRSIPPPPPPSGNWGGTDMTRQI